MSATGPQRVLIVDRSEESRLVLRLVLERHGWQIQEAAEPGLGLELADQIDPDLILLDVEEVAGEPSDQALWWARYSAHSAAHHRSLLLFATWRHERAQQPSLPRAAGGTQRLLAKPYHYAPLLRTIEAMLASPSGTAAEAR